MLITTHLLLFNFLSQMTHNERHWIPAFAGSEWGIRVACDPPTQQSSHTGDEAITAAGYQTVIPAQAGIQRLYLTNSA
jgi:hypothetical protein